jgi:hypothetical protein
MTENEEVASAEISKMLLKHSTSGPPWKMQEVRLSQVTQD